MENGLIPQAIDIVSKAIKADNEKEYESALSLYRDALARFTVSCVLHHSHSCFDRFATACLVFFCSFSSPFHRKFSYVAFSNASPEDGTKIRKK